MNQSKNFLFNTLWAIVIRKLDKKDLNAQDLQLGEIIKDTPLPGVYPFKRLPNVEDFRVSYQYPHDATLASHGIVKRLEKCETESTKYKNKAMNRYV